MIKKLMFWKKKPYLTHEHFLLIDQILSSLGTCIKKIEKDIENLKKRKPREIETKTKTETVIERCPKQVIEAIEKNNNAIKGIDKELKEIHDFKNKFPDILEYIKKRQMAVKKVRLIADHIESFVDRTLSSIDKKIDERINPLIDPHKILSRLTSLEERITKIELILKKES